jgi:EmrB/QacA subfamily drug resistance transporter
MRLIASTPVDRMDGPYPRRWSALLVLCLSVLLILMANTSLVVAAPSMTEHLNLSSSDLEWVLDSYTIPYAALMLMLGSIGDRYSRRGALITGLVVFALGSLVGYRADSFTTVLVGRAIMGIGAAIIMPATLSLLVATFPRNERATAITAWSASSGLAIAAGPLLSGLLLRSYSWPATFIIYVPIAAAAIVAALILVPPSRAERSRRPDLIGGLVSIVAVGALVYTIIEGLHFGWGASALAAAAIAAISLCCFVVWELHNPEPMLDLRKFRDRSFSGAMLTVLLFFFGAFGIVYATTQHIQFVLGYDPLATGVRLLPLAGGVFLGAALTGPLSKKLAIRPVATFGLALSAVALFLLSALGDHSTYSAFLAPFILLGVSVGLCAAPAVDAIMGHFTETDLGVGGATNDTAAELGATLGIALLGSILSSSYKHAIEPLIQGKLPAAAYNEAKDSIGRALIVAGRVAHNPLGGPTQAQALTQAADHAFTHAVAHSSLIGAIILAAGTIAVAVVLPGRRAEDAVAKGASAGATGTPQLAPSAGGADD